MKQKIIGNFFRLCAVFEGIYMLRKNIQGIKLDETNRVTSVVSEGQELKCLNVVMDSNYAPKETFSLDTYHKGISRCALITDKLVEFFFVYVSQC